VLVTHPLLQDNYTNSQNHLREKRLGILGEIWRFSGCRRYTQAFWEDGITSCVKPAKIILSWSGGKDSTMSLHRLPQAKAHDSAALPAL